MKKLFFLTAVGIGYVLGARAGRERYEEIVRLTGKVKDNPKVQQTAHQATDMAKEKASAAASTVTDKVNDKMSSGPGHHKDATDQLHPDSIARQEDPYPQGDLP